MEGEGDCAWQRPIEEPHTPLSPLAPGNGARGEFSWGEFTRGGGLGPLPRANILSPDRGCSEIRGKPQITKVILQKNVVCRFWLTRSARRDSPQDMNATLATTGTGTLLEQLSPFVPDHFINQLCPPHRGRGRQAHWSSAQLYRLSLLALLTPVHSFNLLLRLLPEERPWRQFARLPNRFRVPPPSLLHEFRDRLGVGGLRQINRHLLQPLLETLPRGRPAVGLIDSTDLPAATSAYKKSSRVAIRLAARPWADARSRPGRAGGLSATRNTRCGCG